MLFYLLYLIIILAMLAATVFFGWRRLGSIGRKWALTGAGVVVLGLLGFGWYVSTLDGKVIRNCIAEAMVRSGERPLQSDQFVSIIFPEGGGAVHFRVPADYVFFANNKEDGLGDRLILQARLPDFIPERVAKHQSRPDCTKVTRSPLFTDDNAVEIGIRRGKDFLIRRQIEMHILPSPVKEEFEIIYGLFSLGRVAHPETGKLRGRTFALREGSVRVVPIPLTDHFVPVDLPDGGPGIYVSCMQPEVATYGTCRLHADLSAGLYVEISFDRDKLSEWREIFDSSKDFIEAFIVASDGQPTDRS